MGSLVLVPWHIGDARDLTLDAAAEARRLRVLLVESVEDARRELSGRLKLDLSAKELRAVPEKRDPAFRDEVLRLLEREDVGLLASGGVPGFVDPGAWLVGDLRARGAAIVPRAGASCLSALLSLSGIEWRDKETNAFTFAFFLDGAPGGEEETRFLSLVRRREPVIVFLARASAQRCLRLLKDAAPRRPVTLFFDMTKSAGGDYPMADKVLTRTAKRWLDAWDEVPWERVSDVALMVGP